MNMVLGYNTMENTKKNIRKMLPTSATTNTASSSSGIQVLDRAVSLLEVLATHSPPVTLKILALETGLHASTVFRIAAALQAHGFIERDTSGYYHLGGRLLHYANRVPQRSDIRALAQPWMAQLRDRTAETVNLTVQAGDEVVYIERATPNRMMRVEQVIGSRAPLHVTAVGKLMLAEGGEAAVQAYAQRTGLPRYTANTLTNADQLLQSVMAAKAQGVAFDQEEAECGVACVGVLIRETGGKVVAGLSISAPRERHQPQWVAWLQETGNALSAQLGYSLSSVNLK